VQFFFIAKGSLAEVSAQLEIAAEVYTLPAEKITPLQRECDELGAMLQSLIDHRRK
jgi:four helix bundle protein